jgi:hypothetical protein
MYGHMEAAAAAAAAAAAQPATAAAEAGGMPKDKYGHMEAAAAAAAAAAAEAQSSVARSLQPQHSATLTLQQMWASARGPASRSNRVTQHEHQQQKGDLPGLVDAPPKARKGDGVPRLVLYSAHDTTLMPLLTALGQQQQHW